MVVSRRRKLRGLGLDERVLVGLWTDERGRRRRTDLVRLGTCFSLDSALVAAEAGMARHPEGTRSHRWFRDWQARLRATERAALAAETRYREWVRAHCAGLPAHGDGHGDGGAAPPVAAA